MEYEVISVSHHKANHWYLLQEGHFGEAFAKKLDIRIKIRQNSKGILHCFLEERGGEVYLFSVKI